MYFPDLKVIAVGDLYSQHPDPDYPAGGSLVGWGKVLGEVLKLDFDTVVPGDGPAITKAELEAFKSKLDTFVDRAARLVKSGRTKDQLAAELKKHDEGWISEFSGERLDRFYEELVKRATGR